MMATARSGVGGGCRCPLERMISDHPDAVRVERSRDTYARPEHVSTALDANGFGVIRANVIPLSGGLRNGEFAADRLIVARRFGRLPTLGYLRTDSSFCGAPNPSPNGGNCSFRRSRARLACAAI